MVVMNSLTLVVPVFEKRPLGAGASGGRLDGALEVPPASEARCRRHLLSRRKPDGRFCTVDERATVAKQSAKTSIASFVCVSPKDLTSGATSRANPKRQRLDQIDFPISSASRCRISDLLCTFYFFFFTGVFDCVNPRTAASLYIENRALATRRLKTHSHNPQARPLSFTLVFGIMEDISVIPAVYRCDYSRWGRG